MENLFVVETFEGGCHTNKRICSFKEVESLFIKGNWKESYKSRIRKSIIKSLKEDGEYGTFYSFPYMIVRTLEKVIEYDSKEAHELNQKLEQNKSHNIFGLSNCDFIDLLTAFEHGATYKKLIEYGIKLYFN